MSARSARRKSVPGHGLADCERLPSAYRAHVKGRSGGDSGDLGEIAGRPLACPWRGRPVGSMDSTVAPRVCRVDSVLLIFAAGRLVVCGAASLLLWCGVVGLGGVVFFFLG